MDGTITEYLSDGVEEIAEYDRATGNLLRRYVYGPGVDERIAMVEPDGSRQFYHVNHQRSTVAITDDGGVVIEQFTYNAWGESHDSLTGNPFRYTGRRLDEETGLYYYRARYYSPALGRFLQTDPIGYADGMNIGAPAQDCHQRLGARVGCIDCQICARILMVPGRMEALNQGLDA
ncbi:MAG: RHS repeat-associated core domain-containing protein [Alphaproteobacteria bacterium]